MISVDAQKLKESFSNFYSEYGYENVNIEFFVDLYLEMAEALDEYLMGIKRNQTVLGMSAFSKFNFAVMDGHSATYVLDDLLMSGVIASYPIFTGSLAQRKAIWESASNVLKADILKRSGFFITLSAKRPLDATEPEIMTLDISDLKGTPYNEDVDYLLLDNRVYLIGDAAVASVKNEKLFATNIYVNYKTPEMLLGSRIGIGYTESVSYPEYRDFLQMVTHVLVKGPTVANLKEAFNLLAGWEGANIVDMIGADGVRKSLWNNPTTAILTPFDFLVIVPAIMANTVGYNEQGELVAKTERLDVFKQFIDVVKPTDTNYMVALSIAVKEIIKNSDTIKGLVTVPLSDDIGSRDVIKNGISMKFTERFTHMELLESIKYDSGDLFDNNAGYDETSQDRNVIGVGYGDIVNMNYIQYPEFPVAFDAVKDNLTGQVTCTFKDNAQQVNGYKIYRNETLLTTITPALGNNEIKTYTDIQVSSLPQGEYKYSAKSFYTIGSTEYFSRPSKIISIIK